MNQILSNNNNSYNNYNKQDTKKIIIIFCIAILLIATIIIIVSLVSHNKKKNNGQFDAPTIEIIRETEEAKKVTIKSECADGIKYVVYIWNDEKENKINLEGSTNFERIIDIPENETNTLKVEVVSVNDVSNQKTEELKMNIDTSKPKIDSISIVNSKLQISASDDMGIEYLTYQWENEEEKKVEVNENDNKKIDIELDIKRGTYKLTITVVNVLGNKEQTAKLITGVNQPEISVIKQGGVIHVNVTHDMGFKKIEFKINKKLYVYDENYEEYDENTTEISLDFPLEEGGHLIQIKAYSLEKLSDDDNEELENYSFNSFTGKCTYEPQQ